MEEDCTFKGKSILYKLKSIDKLVVRNLISDLECMQKNEKYKNSPSRSQIEIIQYLLNHINEDVYQRDLEDVLNLRRATISGILGTMEKNGFIERSIDKKDTRIKKITLSPKAKEEYLKRKKSLENIENIVKKNISDDDLKIFNKVIDKMHKNLEDNINNSIN